MKHGLRHIQAFLQVVKTGSFTKAAETLHISQPTLTVQVKQLEEELGVTLFNRDRRTVALTHAGRSMITPLRSILDQYDNAVEQAQDLVGLRRGQLNIATLPSMAAASLPDIIYQFRQLYPNIEIHLADVMADKIIALVKNSSADIGLGPLVSRDRALVFEYLFTDVMHVFFPKNHPLEKLDKPTLKDLTEYPHILTSPQSSVRKTLQLALEANNLTINVACESAYLSTAISMIKAGLGISILPLSVLHAASCDGILHKPINANNLHRRLGLMTLRNMPLSPAAMAFVEIAKQAYE